MFNMEVQQHCIPYIGEGLTKNQIEQLANLSVENVLEEGNVFLVAEALSAMEKFVEAVKKDPRFIDFLRDELSKHKGKITTASGAKLEACEVGTKYNFDLCGDPVYQNLGDQKKQLDHQIKEREVFLKAIPEAGMEIRHEDELVQLYRPTKTSTSSFKVTLSAK
jgi:hypothetical protein